MGLHERRREFVVNAVLNEGLRRVVLAVRLRMAHTDAIDAKDAYADTITVRGG